MPILSVGNCLKDQNSSAALQNVSVFVFASDFGMAVHLYALFLFLVSGRGLVMRLMMNVSSEQNHRSSEINGSNTTRTQGRSTCEVF